MELGGARWSGQGENGPYGLCPLLPAPGPPRMLGKGEASWVLVDEGQVGAPACAGPATR